MCTSFCHEVSKKLGGFPYFGLLAIEGYLLKEIVLLKNRIFKFYYDNCIKSGGKIAINWIYLEKLMLAKLVDYRGGEIRIFWICKNYLQ